MHLRSAQRLVVGVLAGGHLHQRRPAQEDLRLVADEDVVVAHPRLVGAACCRAAEHHRDRGDLQFRQLGDVIEQTARFGEVALLFEHLPLGIVVAAQVAARRFDELDVGHAVVAADLDGSHDLAAGEHRDGPAQHGRVVAFDHALDAVHDADAHHQPAADRVVRAVAGQRADLEEGRVAVHQHRDALPHRHLVPAAHASHRPWPATCCGLLLQLVELGKLLTHVVAVLGEPLSGGVDVGSQYWHVTPA